MPASRRSLCRPCKVAEKTRCLAALGSGSLASVHCAAECSLFIRYQHGTGGWFLRACAPAEKCNPGPKKTKIKEAAGGRLARLDWGRAQAGLALALVNCADKDQLKISLGTFANGVCTAPVVVHEWRGDVIEFEQSVGVSPTTAGRRTNLLLPSS